MYSAYLGLRAGLREVTCRMCLCAANFPGVTGGYCEDLGETLCPPDRAGMADVTQRVATESSFALAKATSKVTVFSGLPLN